MEPFEVIKAIEALTKLYAIYSSQGKETTDIEKKLTKLTSKLV